MKLLHTADWQLGKPFAGIEDPDKRSIVRQERLQCIQRIGEAASRFGAEFIVVAGDLFDSPTPERGLISSACEAIGRLGLPVYAIPGNHDHGGPGSLWVQEFFLQEAGELAPNLHILTTREPVDLQSCILLPCPLLRQMQKEDPTAWLRSVLPGLPDNKPRIVLAHGSVTDFGASGFADEEEVTGANNRIDIERLPWTEIDYAALGDWHGMKEVGSKAWYAGTPEPDRFPKGGNSPGHVLQVDVARGREPVVVPTRTARLGWHWVSENFTDEEGLDRLVAKMNDLLAGRAGVDLVDMELNGGLGIVRMSELESHIERWRARLLRLKLENRVRVVPAPDEVAALTQRASDPLIARVAARLIGEIEQEGEKADAARAALRILYTRASTGQS
ncbi:MAG: DNA repair exonuclease [Terrimicrobiaceae bacterium]